IVLKYAEKGSLRQNLSYVSQMEWKKKLNLLHCIVTDLEAIHSQGMIHRDLHSGNILQDTLDSAYIVDLGLSMSSNEKKEGEEICGILPYIDPQVLLGQNYSQTADIYSFGIIMWEVLYGITISYIVNKSKNEADLQLRICCDGLRPPINKEATSCYVDLMEECWSKDPKIRPSAEKLCEIFKKWQYDENILLELNKSKIKLENIEKSYVDMISKGSKFYPHTKSIFEDQLLIMDCKSWPSMNKII
ncbi:kinase-like domain-containing protein, partial [Gigaspora rosea]